MIRRMEIVAAFSATLVCAISSEASVGSRREAASVVRTDCKTDAKSGPRANPDDQFRDLWSAEVKGGRFTMPPKMACAAVEIWLGREKIHVRARVNGVLAAEYDSRADGLREFRFEAEKVLKWGEENVVEFEDAKGAKLNLPFTVKVLKLVD